MASRLFGGRRKPRRPPDPDAIRRARSAARGPGGHPGRGLRDGHPHPGGGAAARPQGQGRGGPGPDRHRQDGRLPDRDLHAAAPHARRRPPRGRRRARSSSRPRASWSSRSRRTRGSSAASRVSASALVYGGIDYIKQRESLRRPVDVLVGTPGRLIDYLKQHVWSPAPGRGARHRRGRPDVRHGLHRRPPLHPPPAAAARGAAVVPVLGHAVLPRARADLGVHEQPRADHDHRRSRRRWSASSSCSTTSGREEKFGLLLGLLAARAGRPHPDLLQHARGGPPPGGPPRAQRLRGAGAHAATSTRSKRLRILNDFKDGQLPVLVATDVASRGLHIEDVTHVVQLGPAAGPRGLRPPDRPHGAGGRVGQGHQPGRRGERALARGRREVHRPEDPRGVGGGRALPARDQADRRGAPPLGGSARGPPGRPRGPRAAPGRPQPPPARPPPGGAPA